MSAARSLLLLLAFVAATVEAAPPKASQQAARAAYQRGIRHYNLSEFEDALKEFKDAYRAVPDSSLLFNIAQCQRQLKLYPDAVRTYRAFLREAPEVPNRSEVEKLVVGLERAIEEQEAARVRAPQGLSTQESAPSPAPVVVSTPAPVEPPAREKPAYKKWWVWTIVGVAAVAGIAVGLGVGLAPPRYSYPAADTPGGRVQF